MDKSETQKAAEAKVEAFRRELGPFVVAAETTRMPMIFTDARSPGNPIVFANDSFLSLTGFAREEVLGKNVGLFMAQGMDSRARTDFDRELEGESGVESAHRFRRKDGSEFRATTFVSAVRNEDGEVMQNFASFVDQTRHEQEQAHARMLIHELNHRVKNTLATVQSIIRQAFRRASTAEGIQEAIESRLFALGRSHDLLAGENWQGVGLFDLVKGVLGLFNAGDEQTKRYLIEGENILLPPKATLVLGIVLNELATNAMKHGALSNLAGSIMICWNLEPQTQGNRLILRWVEKDGPPVTPPNRNGFGSQMIERGIPHELEGIAHLDYQAAGLRCTISMPAPVSSDG